MRDRSKRSPCVAVTVVTSLIADEPRNQIAGMILRCPTQLVHHGAHGQVTGHGWSGTGVTAASPRSGVARQTGSSLHQPWLRTPVWSEELAHVAAEEVGCLQSREVAAPVETRPAHDGVARFGVAPAREPVSWWSETSPAASGDPARTLYARLRASVGSPIGQVVFDAYGGFYGRVNDEQIPALIPQVYLHYDPYTVRELERRNGRCACPTADGLPDPKRTIAFAHFR